MKKDAHFGLVILLGLTLLTAGCAANPPPVNGPTPTATTKPQIEAATPTEVLESPTANGDEPDHLALLLELLFEARSEEQTQSILARIRASGDRRFVAGLIDILRYQPNIRVEVGRTLNVLTGQDLPPNWFEWVEWAGRQPEIESFADYPTWKATLFARLIDPNFLRFIYPELKIAPGSRVEEVVWGGVRVDGIPALDNPTMIDPEEADYLVPNERVFGVSINGDTRAYPARFLDWHEMFNDTVGGEPVSLAY